MKSQYKEAEFTTPDFLQAIQASDFEAVKDLIIKGANVNALDYSRIPVFAHAIYTQNDKIIDLFLAHGALVNPEYDRVEITPLGAACKVASLADSTKNINYTFSKLVDLGANLNPENCFSAPLTEVIRANGPCSEKMALYISKLGANINPIIDHATTPLATATQIAIKTFSLGMIETCLALNANINPLNPTQISPLTTAASLNNNCAKIIAEFLINKGAKLDSNYLYNSPLYQAVQSNNQAMCELLIEKGANVKSNNFNNVDLFDAPIRNGNLDMLKYLMSKGMKLDWDKALQTSLNCTQPSVVEMVEFLLSKSENYDKKEFLVKAINHQNPIIVNLLTEKNGIINLSDYQGSFNLSTPFCKEMAIKFNHPVSKILTTVNSGNIDKIFEITNTLIKSPNLDNATTSQILEFIKQAHGPSLIQKILMDNRSDPSKAIKTLTLFQLKYTFKNDKFVLTTQTSGNEVNKNSASEQSNLPEIKEQSKTYIKDGKLYLTANNTLLDNNNINNLAECGTHYVINKKGMLFVNAKGYAMCHSYFLKGTEGKTSLDGIPMYGYGKPVACGGHIKFKDGLITKITNGSGHYMPNIDQFKLVCKHFKDLGVLSEDVVIEAHNRDVNDCVKIENDDFLDSIVAGDILATYPELV